MSVTCCLLSVSHQCWLFWHSFIYRVSVGHTHLVTHRSANLKAECVRTCKDVLCVIVTLEWPPFASVWCADTKLPPLNVFTFMHFWCSHRVLLLPRLSALEDVGLWKRCHHCFDLDSPLTSSAVDPWSSKIWSYLDTAGVLLFRKNSVLLECALRIVCVYTPSI